MFLTQRFPKAEKVQLSVLIEKYNFSQEAIDEIKKKWKYIPSSGCYVKPGGIYDISTLPSNPQESNNCRVL